MFIVEFFTNPEIGLNVRVLEILFLVMGIICLYTAVKNLRDPENPSPLGTAIFWGSLGIVIAFGRWLPSVVNGGLVITMALPAVFRKVKIGQTESPTKEYTASMSDRIGMKIFIPALSIGICAIIFALFIPQLGALVGVGVGVAISAISLMALNHETKPGVFLHDSRRLLDVIGPLCMLPMLLAALGAVFTAAGVGDVIAALVAPIIPYGNVVVGIIVYAVGMALFTMIMGNAFAAITVMTVGIGAPFVLAHGADPVVVGMLALTSGYCGTLMTPMAANFNIVPVAMLDMKDKYGVIKNQIAIAIPVLIFQIILMILLH